MKLKKLLAESLALALMMTGTGALARAQGTEGDVPPSGAVETAVAQQAEETAVPTQVATEVPTAVPTQAATEVPTAEPTQAATEAPTAEPTQAATETPTAEPTDDHSAAIIPGAEVPGNVETPAPDTFVSAYAHVRSGVSLYRDKAREDKLGELTGDAVMMVCEVDGYENLYETYFDTDETKNEADCERAYFYASELERLTRAETEAVIANKSSYHTAEGVRVLTAPVRYEEVVEETETPTEEPTDAPTETPTEEPTEAPTEVPTEEPTEVPTEAPTEEPTETPTEEPTEAPTEEPTEAPTAEPTVEPTEEPEMSALYTVVCFDADGQRLGAFEVTGGEVLDEALLAEFRGESFLGWYACAEDGTAAGEEPFAFGSPVEGNVYLRARSAAPEATEAPAERRVDVVMTRDTEALQLGSQITLTAVLEGYGELETICSWECAAADRAGNILGEWQVAYADAPSITYELTEENLLTAWRVRVTVSEPTSAEPVEADPTESEQ